MFVPLGVYSGLASAAEFIRRRNDLFRSAIARVTIAPCQILDTIVGNLKGDAAMKVKKGDVLVCSGPDCDLELTVTQVCKGQTCHADQECDITVNCGGNPVEVRSSGEGRER
jgi:hypothetical protein